MEMRKVVLFILLLAHSTVVFSSETREKLFWDWFVKNENTLFSFENNQDKVLNLISSKLSECQYDLVFEISRPINGKRQLVISADGISDRFPHVQSLVGAAPSLPRWDIIAFRPRLNDYAKFKLQYAGKDIDPSKIWIYHRIEKGNFDLIVYHPEYTGLERAKFVGASYILLDMALGEYDVATGIRYIDHQRLPDNPLERGLRPFSELREIFDEYKSKLKPNAGLDSI